MKILSITLICIGFSLNSFAACTTVADAVSGEWVNHAGTGNICGPPNGATAMWEYQKAATKFVAGSSYTACSAELALFSYSGVHATNYYHSLRVGIYTDGGNEPTTLVGTPSDWVPALSVGTAPLNAQAITWSNTAPTTFTGLNASLTSGTTYWLVLEPNVTIAATNYPVHWKAAAAGGEFKMYRSGAWNASGLYSTHSCIFRLFK